MPLVLDPPADRVMSPPLGGYVELPVLASKVDAIAALIADVEWAIPDAFCEEIDLDVTQARSDFRRLATNLLAAAKPVSQ